MRSRRAYISPTAFITGIYQASHAGMGVRLYERERSSQWDYDNFDFEILFAVHPRVDVLR
jgi:hypothetical protein